ARFRYHPGKCDAYLRSRFRQFVPARGKRMSPRGASEYAVSLRGVTQSRALPSPREWTYKPLNKAETGGSRHRPCLTREVSLRRSRNGCGSKAWRLPHGALRTDAQRSRVDWAPHYLSSRSSAVQRQTDRAGAELRRSGRHRHREHAAAERITP